MCPHFGKTEFCWLAGFRVSLPLATVKIYSILCVTICSGLQVKTTKHKTMKNERTNPTLAILGLTFIAALTMFTIAGMLN